MLEVKDGKIFVEGVETIDAELIGMAFKDWQETLPEDSEITFSKGRVFGKLTN